MQTCGRSSNTKATMTLGPAHRACRSRYTNASVYLMYTVALTVDALVDVDAPESKTKNNNKKTTTHKWCLYLNGIAIYHGNGAFLSDKPTTTTLKKAMLQSRAIISVHGKKENFGAGG